MIKQVLIVPIIELWEKWKNRLTKINIYYKIGQDYKIVKFVTYEHKEGIMAKPIKETPVLYGKDAQKFEKKITLNKVNTAPKPEYDRVMNNYNKIKEKMQKV